MWGKESTKVKTFLVGLGYFANARLSEEQRPWRVPWGARLEIEKALEYHCIWNL